MAEIPETTLCTCGHAQSIHLDGEGMCSATDLATEANCPCQAFDPAPEVEEPVRLVNVNAAGEPLDVRFEVTGLMEGMLTFPDSQPFDRLAEIKAGEPRSWVSAEMSLRMLRHLEAQVAEALRVARAAQTDAETVRLRLEGREK